MGDTVPMRACLLFLCSLAFAADQPRNFPPPAVKGFFGSLPDAFRSYSVVLEPDKNEPEWWAGAPSVVRDRKGVFWLACRMRTADAPLGLRGYEIRILRSEDGIRFRKAHSIKREQVGTPGFERPAIVIDQNPAASSSTDVLLGKAAPGLSSSSTTPTIPPVSSPRRPGR